MASASRPARSEIREQAGLLLASALGLACGIATLGLPYSIGIVVKPLQAEFGWTLAEIMAVQPIVTLAVIAAAVVVGWLADRHGVRRLIVVSQAAFGLGLAAIGAFTHSLASFYAIYFVVGLLSGGTLAITFTKLVAARFERQRGLALGIALSGTGLCSIVFQPYMASVVQAWGWRAGYFAIALLPLLLALPASLRWARDAPAHDAPAAAPGSAPVQPSTPFAAVLRDWRYWAMCVAFFTFSGAITAVLNNFPPILMERGYDAVAAASIAGTFGIAVIAGRLTIGALVDRWWAPLVGLWFFAPSAAGLWVLASGAHGTLVTVMLVGLAGLAAGAEVDLMAYLASRYFGLRDFGKVYGSLYVGFALGPGVLVPAFAAARDAAGSYGPGLRTVAVAILAAGLLLLALGPYPDSRRAAAPA